MSEAPAVPGNTSPGPEGSEVAGSCNIDELGKLKAAHPEGVFLLIAQTGCRDCTEMKAVLGEAVGDKKTIVEADLVEDKECISLAHQVKAEVTPTVIYYEGENEVARLFPDGTATWDTFRQKLRELTARTPAAVPRMFSPTPLRPEASSAPTS